MEKYLCKDVVFEIIKYLDIESGYNFLLCFDKYNFRKEKRIISLFIKDNININNMVQNQLKKCGPSCFKYYNINKLAINKILKNYKNLLPLLFVYNLPKLSNIFGAILNDNKEFDRICLKCSWYII